MLKLSCPICEAPVEVPPLVEERTRVTCHNCFAQLAVYRQKDEIILTCAMCKESIFDPENCENCDRRREKKRIFEEGRL